MVKKIFIFLNIFLITNLGLHATFPKKEISCTEHNSLENSSKQKKSSVSKATTEKPHQRNYIRSFLERHVVKIVVTLGVLSIVGGILAVKYYKSSLKNEEKYIDSVSKRESYEDGVKERYQKQKENFTQSLVGPIEEAKKELVRVQTDLEQKTEDLKQAQEELRRAQECIAIHEMDRNSHVCNMSIETEEVLRHKQATQTAQEELQKVLSEKQVAERERDEAIQQKQRAQEDRNSVVQLMQPSYFSRVYDNLSRISTFLMRDLEKVKVNSIVSGYSQVKEIPTEVDSSQKEIMQAQVVNLIEQVEREVDEAIQDLEKPVIIANKGYLYTTTEEKSLSPETKKDLGAQLDEIKRNIQKVKENIV